MRLKSWISDLAFCMTSIARSQFQKQGCRTRRNRRAFAYAATETLETRTLLTTVSWDGGSGTSNWEDSDNWSGNEVPTILDDVMIDLPGGTIFHRFFNHQVRSITSNAAIDLIGGSLDIGADHHLSGEVRVSGGTLIASGTLNVTVTWAGGSIFVPENTTLTNAGSLLISRGDAGSFIYGTLANTGTVIHYDDTFLFCQDAHIINQVGGVYDLQSGVIQNNTNNNLFTNYGTLRKSTAEGMSQVYLPSSNLDGLVEVQGGTLQFLGGNSTDGTFVIAEDAVVQFGGNTHTFNGTTSWIGDGTVKIINGEVIVSSGATSVFNSQNGLHINGGVLTVNGTVQGTIAIELGLLSGSGTLDAEIIWTNGNITGVDAGLTNVGTLTIGGNASHFLTGTLVNAGTVIQSDESTSNPFFLADGHFVNQSGGVYDLQFGDILHFSGTNLFTNYGTLRKSSVEGIVGVNIPFANEGSIELLGGELVLNDGTYPVVFDGDAFLAVAAGAALHLPSSIIGSTQNATQFAVPGTVEISFVSNIDWEAMGHDVGRVAAGFEQNFAYGTFSILSGAYVKIIDSADNATGPGAEAIYVDRLVIAGGATLDLNSLHVYAHTVDNNGTIIGGTVNIVPLLHENEGPTAVELSSSSIAENQPSGTAIGDLFTIDPNLSDVFTYALVDGPGSNSNAYFSIVGHQLVSSASFDYEAQPAYSIRVRSTDQGGLWIENSFIIQVTNANDAPESVNLVDITAPIFENTTLPTRLKLADIVVRDDALGNNVLSLAGPDAGVFSIDNGRLFLNALTVLDFETKAAYHVTILADDTSVGATPDASLNYTLTVVDVPESAAPVIAGFDTQVTYTENGAPVLLDTNATITDTDSPDFVGGELTVTIPVLSESTDRLGIRNQGSLTNQVGAADGVVSYSGNPIGTYSGGTPGNVPLVVRFGHGATKAAVQAVLRNLVFSHDSDTPLPVSRPVEVQLADGDGGLSSVASKSIKVVPVNDKPVVETFSGTLSYIENAEPHILAADATVSDVDSADFELGRLTVKVAVNAQSTDLISILPDADSGGIGINGSEVTYGGVVVGTRTGTTTLTVTFNSAANRHIVQEVLRHVAYSNTSHAPSTLPRTITATLTDGDGGNSVLVSTSVTVTALNDDPVIGAFDLDVTYRENGNPLLLDTNATAADGDLVDFDTGMLTVDLTSNGHADDRLGIRHQGYDPGQVGILGADQVTYGGLVVATFTGGTTGTDPLRITFNTEARQAAVQAIVRNLVYRNISDDPSTLPRTVRLQLTDGDGGTAMAVTKTIKVTAINDKPVVENFVNSFDYTEGESPILLALGATVTDLDSANFDGGKLTIRISANRQTQDRISIRDQGTAEGEFALSGTEVTYEGLPIGSFVGTNSLTVTFNANATAEIVQSLLRNITFHSITDAVSELPRTIAASLSDGDGATSTTVTTTVNVIAVNDNPAIGGFGPDISYRRGTAPVLIDSNATVVDLDLLDFAGAILTVDVIANGNSDDQLSIRNQGVGNGQISLIGNEVYLGTTTVPVLIGTFSGGSSATALTVEFNSAAKQAAVQSLIRNLTYQNTSSAAGQLARTIRLQLTDGDDGEASPVTKLISIV